MEQGGALFGRSNAGWRSGVVDLGRVMGLVLARRESSAPWLLAGAGARQQKRGGGSAYSWAASMEKKLLHTKVVEQEMVAGFLLPENRGRASVAGAHGRRGWSFGRRPWKSQVAPWEAGDAAARLQGASARRSLGQHPLQREWRLAPVEQGSEGRHGWGAWSREARIWAFPGRAGKSRGRRLEPCRRHGVKQRGAPRTGSTQSCCSVGKKTGRGVVAAREK
jgi:hypothetical protein